ncbi:MAG TPA: DUF4270 domain-containing protein [Flavobacteriaceae bacterium]|nr:DUF4270 domain-containing protein [Flavobacteriaceae bacterium]
MLKNILKIAIIAGVLVSWSSCEDDFSPVGTDLLGDSGFITEPYDEVEIVSYSKKINSVQTSALPQYLLGAYYDPVYGVSEANILAQLTLSAEDPDFGQNPVLDSVVLVLPYFSTQIEKTAEETTYRLDSVYGDSPVKLSIYESNYFLRDLDPETNFEEPQIYYSDQLPEFENNLGTLLATVDNFVPKKDEVILYNEVEGSDGETTTDTLKLSPRMRIPLDVDFFQTKILDKQGSTELFNNANFKSYFRGIYLKAEAIDGKGTMMALNMVLDDAKIVLYYTSSTEDESTEDPDDTIESSFKYDLKFVGNTVNVYNNQFQVDLTVQDTVNGEENLYLKGGQGSMVVVELFAGSDSDDDGVSDRLEELREKNWLINEANLTFYVNSNLATTSEKRPERVFIYDLNNNTVLLDYQIDYTASESLPLNSRTIHLEPLNEDKDGNNYYKIRLTAHVSNIINNDSTNVKLGLVVSSNVNLTTISKLNTDEENVVTKIPKSSLITPEGTVLYGNNSPIDDKRLKLNIYYTKPE